MIIQCAILFTFLALGELVVYTAGIPIPSSIVGMIALTAALKFKIIRLSQIERISDFLVKNLGFFFVPEGVGVMNCFGLIQSEWLPIVVASVISTFLVIGVTGWVHQLTRSKKS
jgi:holin-like protein